MKICPKCSTQNRDNAVFCKECGASLPADAASPVPKGEAAQMLVNPTENILSVYGSSYFANYVSTGNVEKGFAVLTSKRVYFRGKSFSLIGSKWRKFTQERIVDLQDVTSTGYTMVRPYGHIVRAIAFFVVFLFMVAVASSHSNGFAETSADNLFFDFCNNFNGIFLFISIIEFILYFIHRHNLFCIAFAGGEISFDVKWYPERDAHDFQQQLHLAKDNKRMSERREIKEAVGKSVSSGKADD